MINIDTHHTLMTVMYLKCMINIGTHRTLMTVMYLKCMINNSTHRTLISVRTNSPNIRLFVCIVFVHYTNEYSKGI